MIEMSGRKSHLSTLISRIRSSESIGRNDMSNRSFQREVENLDEYIASDDDFTREEALEAMRILEQYRVFLSNKAYANADKVLGKGWEKK